MTRVPGAGVRAGRAGERPAARAAAPRLLRVTSRRAAPCLPPAPPLASHPPTGSARVAPPAAGCACRLAEGGRAARGRAKYVENKWVKRRLGVRAPRASRRPARWPRPARRRAKREQRCGGADACPAISSSVASVTGRDGGGRVGAGDGGADRAERAARQMGRGCRQPPLPRRVTPRSAPPARRCAPARPRVPPRHRRAPSGQHL